MRAATSVVLGAALLALFLGGCEAKGRKGMWDIVEELHAAEPPFKATPPPALPRLGFEKGTAADMPCLRTCHDPVKWATGKPYPHAHPEHKDNGKRCVDCHSVGHRSAKAKRTLCKECH